MHKTLFALAALIACSGYFVRSLGAAHAIPSGPSVDLGTQPWRSFTGQADGSGKDLTIVPADRVFIVTTVVAHEYVNLYEDSILRLEGSSKAGTSSADCVLAMGNGHMVFEPGTTVRIRNGHSGSGYDYYVEGYFARP